MWHTGSRGARWGDADAGRPGLPSHSPCAGRRQAEKETAAAWSLPMAAVGDGSVTHEARSGGGPGEGGLANTRWRDRGWVGRSTPTCQSRAFRLHESGFAHSAEAWADGELVGGLYGVSLGAAFFGESMFAWRPEASKVAFVHLVQCLHAWHFHLVDCQTYSDHLARFGAVLWCRERFLRALARALQEPTHRGQWRVPDGDSCSMVDTQGGA